MDLAQASFGSAKNTVHRDFKKAQTAFFRDSKPVNLSVIGTYPVPAWAARRYARLGPHSRRAGSNADRTRIVVIAAQSFFEFMTRRRKGSWKGTPLALYVTIPDHEQ